MKEEYKGLVEVINSDNIKFDEPIAKYTTMKVGGPCDVIVFPNSVEDIKKVIDYAKTNNLKWIVLGNGSNIIVKDEGIRGIIIKLNNKFGNIKVEGEHVIADAGAAMPKVAQIAKNNLLSGFEFACGIPGTIGGGVKMNAGAYGGQLSDIIESVDYLDGDGNVQTLRNEDLRFAYRHSIFADERSWLVLSAKFKLTKGNLEDIETKMKENNLSRKTKQPLEYPNAGSVFKRPTGYFVGKLISDANLKGVSVGGAQVSEKHAGFIVNKGGATCQDIMDLIKVIQKTVYEKFDVMLQTEVEIIGGQN